jgi:Uma2 family endonuclease
MLKGLIKSWFVKEKENSQLEKILDVWNNPRHGNINLNSDKCEIGMANLATKSIDINSDRIKELMGEEHIETVLSHEVGHIALCPYDLKTLLVMNYVAQKQLGNKVHAQNLTNLFQDIVVNSYIHDFENPEKIVGALDKGIMKDNKLAQIYLRFYEKHWELPENTLIQKKDLDSEVETRSEELKNLFEEKIYNHKSWCTKLPDFCDILRKYQQELEDMQENSAMGGNNKGKKGDGGDQEDIMSNAMGIGDIDIQKFSEEELDEALGKIAKEFKMFELKELSYGLEKGDPKRINALYYKAQGEKYKLHLPKVISNNGELFPMSVKQWNPEDEATKLDINYSLQNYGTIIPGVTTFQWNHEEGLNFKQNYDCPDLLIILDSSGSMPDPEQYESLAVISAMAAKKSALNLGARVAALNFSGDHREINYTNDEEEIDKGLLYYYDGGTVLPTDSIHKIVKGNSRKQHLVLITDACMDDFKGALHSLDKTLQRARAGGTVFLINNQDENIKRSFEDIGYNVHLLENQDQLLNLVLEDIKQTYEV